MALIDLAHPIEDGMAAYPGLPPVRIITIIDHEASRDRYGGRAEFLLGGAELAGNTGTYLDEKGDGSWYVHRQPCTGPNRRPGDGSA